MKALTLLSQLTLLMMVVFMTTGCRRNASPAMSPAMSSSMPETTLTRVTAPEVFEHAKTSGAKITLVNVWATWCGPCQAEMPEIAKFQKSYANKGVQVLLVSADSHSDEAVAAKFLANAGVDFPSYILGQSPGEFVKATKPDWNGGLPATYLLGPDGKIKLFWVGRSTYRDLETKVKPLLGLQGS